MGADARPVPGGRQTEALRIYQHARRVLLEEIGVEPGRERQRLEHAILAQDPTLDLAASADRAHTPNPTNVPAPVTALVDRDRELRDVLRALDDHRRVTIWCSDVLEQRAGLTAGVAATGVTAIVAGLTLGRLAGSRFTRSHRPEWLLYRAIAVYLIGFAMFWTSTVGWLSFVGLFVSGLGLALLFPLGLARVIALSDGRPDLATARASLGAGLAVGTGPFVLGALADGFGTHQAFLLVPVLAGAAVFGIGLGGRAAATA